MTMPTFDVLKMVTSNGRSPFAVSNVASNCGCTPRDIEALVKLGAAALTAQAAQVKATPASPRREQILAMARGAWLIAMARGIK